MIYSTEISAFPTEGKYSECFSYMDENDFEWKIARVENGFFAAYFGSDYFKHSRFDLEVHGKRILVKNSGCFFVQNTGFDTFYEFREIVKSGWTDTIWECIVEMLEERLSHDSGLTECEIIK